MRIDLQRVITLPDGTVTTKQGTAIPFLVKNACIEALLTRYQDELNLSGEENYNRYRLAYRIEKGEDNFTPEEIVLIKRLVNKNYGPLVYGHVCDAIIDPANVIPSSKPTKTE